jgi:hypothetical protein
MGSRRATSQESVSSSEEQNVPVQRDDEQNDDEEWPTPREPSRVAQKIERLRRASLQAAQERERLPQPLFWSLFQHKIEEMKREKELRRLLDELLG